MLPSTLQVTPQITESFGALIKQYAGQSQMTKDVRVKVTGMHFTGLTKAKQKVDYWVSQWSFASAKSFRVTRRPGDKRIPVPGSASSAKMPPSKNQTTETSG